MRRSARAALALLLTGTLGAAACQGTSARQCGADGSGPVTFATVKNLTAEQRDHLTGEWAKQYPAEPLRIVVLPSTSDQQRAQLAATLRVGARGGAARRDGYDVVGLDVVFLPEFARLGLLQPLDETRYSDSGFFTATWRTSKWGKRLYAVPFTTNVGLLYYRADELVELNVLSDQQQRWRPHDWQTVLTVARESRLAGSTGPVGYTGQLAAYEGLTANTLEIVYGEGGELPTPGHPVTPAQQDGAARGIGFLIDGLRNRWIDGAALGYDEQASLNAFADERALILRHWPDAWTTLARTGQPVGVTRLPPGSGVLGGESLAVARCSPYRETAQRLIAFLTARRQQKWFFEAGLYLPTVESLYADGTLSATPGLPPGFIPLLRESLNDARGRPADPAWNTTSRTIQTRIHGALERAATAPVDAADVVTDLAGEFD